MSLFAVGSRDYSFYACNQFIRIEQQFFSKVSLSGKTLYVGPDFTGECDCERQPSPAASISYPFAPGVYEMSGPGNGVMMIEVTNDKVFKIVWDFWNNGSATSQVCNFDPQVNGLTLCVGYNQTLSPTESQQQNDPCATDNQCWIGVCASIGLGASCDCGLEFRLEDAVTGNPLNGLNPNNSTRVVMEGSGQIGNTFFVGNCNGGGNIVSGDTVSTLEGIPGGVTQVGAGFINYELGTNNAIGWFTIQPGQTGRYYVVYSDGCQYNTCIVDVDNQNDNPDPEDDPDPCNIPPVYGDVSCSITVADQPPVSACCVSAPSGTSVQVSVTMDTGQYNSQVVALGGTGSFATNFVGGGVCVGTQPSESECPGGVTTSGSTLTWSGGIPDEDTYLSFSYTFNIANEDGEICEHVIIKHVLLRPTVQTDINLIEWRDQGGNPIEGPYCLGEVTSITGVFSGPDGDTFTVTPGDGTNVTGSSGSFAGGEGTVTVSTEGLNPFQNYCFEIESNGDGDPGPDPDPDQGECQCPSVGLNVTVDQAGAASAALSVNYSITGVPTFTTTLISLSSPSGFGQEFQFPDSSGNFTHNAGLSGGSVLATYDFTIFDAAGCVYRFTFNISLANENQATTFCQATCQEPGQPVTVSCTVLDQQEDCPNFPALDISCSDGLASVAPGGTINSPVDTDFTYFDSTGSSTTDERLDLAVRIISFTDGCPELTIYDCSLCDEDEDIDVMLECMNENTPGINCIFDEDSRTLELESVGEVVDVVTDVVEYSIDGGVTYTEYTTPFAVAEGVTEVLWRRTTNYALCPETIIEGVCNLPGSPDEEGCVDQTPTLTCSWDANSTTHSAQAGGTVTNVLSDTLTYDNGGGPQPYTSGQQISGDAVAFNRVVEFLNNCPTICLSCLSLSSRLVDPCIPDPDDPDGDPIPNPDFINNTTVNVTVEIPPDSIVVNVEVPPDSINVVCSPNVNIENIIDACCPEPEDPATIDCDPIPTTTCAP